MVLQRLPRTMLASIVVICAACIVLIVTGLTSRMVDADARAERAEDALAHRPDDRKPEAPPTPTSPNLETSGNGGGLRYTADRDDDRDGVEVTVESPRSATPTSPSPAPTRATPTSPPATSSEPPDPIGDLTDSATETVEDAANSITDIAGQLDGVAVARN